MRTIILCSVFSAALALAQQPSEPTPIDFTKVDRTPPKLPASSAARTFGLYLFGPRGEHRVWAVFEAPAKDQPPTALWFDRDGNGELTDDERIAGKTADKARTDGEPPPVAFKIGDFRTPGSESPHRDVSITWTPKIGTRFRMLWRGDKVSFGGYGPTLDTYAAFAGEPKNAPIFVPGHDRPFQFERWQTDALVRGSDTDFKVFVGNRGDRTGAFAAVDDEFLPDGEFVVATLHYQGQDGKPATQRFELRERC
ncbi:MAG: hypothetical protein IPK26_14475 [Planctomycetes bacterium]|nr:hypothetical protein [Planctomycetota bacterium]